MNSLAVALVYLGFFGLIAFAVWFTGSAWCLWALLLTPQYKSGNSGDKEKSENEVS